MLVKVDDYSRNKVMDYVVKEPSINLFIIGDIEQFGFNEPFQDVYLQVEGNEITAVLLRYYGNVIVYSDRESFNREEIINKIKEIKPFRISGKKTIIDILMPYLEDIKEVDECFFCELNSSEKLIDTQIEPKVAIIDDVERIYPLMVMVQFDTKTFIEAAKRRIQSRAGRTYFIEQDGVVVSSAGTAIESSVSAMIGGVATHINYRNQGLASQIVSKLCQDLIKENKKPCLFFHNPTAGKIYHRLGFVDIDMWTMLTLNE